jgi:hypothetical protein
MERTLGLPPATPKRIPNDLSHGGVMVDGIVFYTKEHPYHDSAEEVIERAKSKRIAELKEQLLSMSSNIVSFDEADKLQESFKFTCRKCEATDVFVVGSIEGGACYSSYTGCDPSYAKLGLKCRGCGAAVLLEGSV